MKIRMVNRFILNPNCSEYVQRLTLTSEELKYAKRVALELVKDSKLDSVQLKEFYDELENSKDSMGQEEFISEGLATPYEIIKNEIEEKRKALDILKREWWQRKNEES